MSRGPMPEPGAGEPSVDDRAALRGHVMTIARGGGFLAGGSFFDFATRFVIGFLLARVLGPADYGLYHLAIGAATMFAGVSSLGLDDAMVRYVAIQSGRKDRQGVWGTIQIGLGIALPTALALGGALYVAAAPVAEGLFDEPALTPILRLMAFVVPFLTLSNVLLGVTRGFGRMDYATVGENVVQPVVRMTLLLVMALIGLDVFAAAVIFGIADVAASVTFIVLTGRRYAPRQAAERAGRRDFASVFGFALPLWVSGLINQFHRNISVFLLGGLAATASVGIFAVVAQVNYIGHVVYRSVIVAVKPLLAQLHDRRDRLSLNHIYTTTTRWLVMANVPFFLAMALYPRPILAIFGDEFTAGAYALVVLAVAELVNAGTGICGSLIDMTGHTRVKVVNSVASLVTLAGANVLLVPRWGVLGAAVASLLAITVVNLLRMAELWVLERVFPSWRAYAKPIAAGSVALLVGSAMQQPFPVGDALVPALGQGMVVVAVYIGSLALFGVDEEDRAVMGRVAAKGRGRLRRSGTRG